MPCLKLSFDGQEQTNEETRLEAFMHQAYQRMEGRLHSKKHGVVRHKQKEAVVAGNWQLAEKVMFYIIL